MAPRPATTARPVENPFPGLRAFEPDEDHLFFGRDRQIDELLRRLRTTRFLAVVGGSGSGKSSLVKSGLVPNLHRGYLATAGSHWRVAILRPGEAPLRNLAAALAAPEVLGSAEPVESLTLRTIVEGTLRSSSQGLADAVAQARLPTGDNVLVVIDQFEELFRFPASRHAPDAWEEARAFVKLLLTAAAHPGISLYFCLTLRSEYLGECLHSPGLPEAVNNGQYLVPRMSRDELRAAVTGPVAVGGARIAPGLVTRLLNDAGEAANQLPVLQHALMRTWDHWRDRTGGEGEIAIDDYEAVGTMHEALSRHAEEAFAELSPGRQQLLARRIFQALTETGDDQQGVRRPTAAAELCAVCEAPLSEVDAVIERFRRQGRTFLMPPPGTPLEPATVIDLSHEALMRIWGRLGEWTAQERESASLYRRLAQSAALHARGAEGLWHNPQLRLALDWRRRQQPNAAWADRYGGALESTLAFLDRSCNAQRLRQGALFAALALAVLAILLGLAWRARLAQQEARQAEERVQELQRQIDDFLKKNPQLAQEAVDLRSANRDLSLRILEVEAESRDLQWQLTSLTGEGETLVAKRGQLQEAIARLDQERATLTAAVKKLEVDFAAQEARERRVSEELQKLFEENGALRARAIESGVVVEMINRYGVDAKAAAAPKREELRFMVGESPVVGFAPSPVKSNALEKQLELLREENLRLKLTAQELRRENNRLQARLKPLEEAAERLKRDVAARLQQNRALIAENAQLEKNRAARAQEVQELSSRRTDLEIKIKAVTNSVYRLEGLILLVREENDTLRRVVQTPRRQ